MDNPDKKLGKIFISLRKINPPHKKKIIRFLDITYIVEGTTNPNFIDTENAQFLSTGLPTSMNYSLNFMSNDTTNIESFYNFIFTLIRIGYRGEPESPFLGARNHKAHKYISRAKYLIMKYFLNEIEMDIKNDRGDNYLIRADYLRDYNTAGNPHFFQEKDIPYTTDAINDIDRFQERKIGVTLISEDETNTISTEIYDEFIDIYCTNSFINPIANGDVQIEKGILILRAIKKAIEDAEEKLYDDVVDAISKYGKDGASINGAKINIKEVGVKYDFENCKDDIWNDIKVQLEELKKKPSPNPSPTNWESSRQSDLNQGNEGVV